MGTQDEGPGDGNAAGGADAKKDNIYENRTTSKKIIRVVTVIAYMISVSFVAIVLSAYYVFLWQPPNPRLMHGSHHLRADPQIEYLMDKPPTEVTLNETLSPAQIRDKVNVFREEILRTRGVNISFRSQHQQPQSLEEKAKNSNVSHVDHVTLTNGTVRNNSRASGALWNPIVRALLATTETPSTQITLGNSTDVYKSFNVGMKSSTGTDSLRASTVFMETREINGPSTSRVSSSSSSPSSLLTESKGKLYNVSVNDFTLMTATAFTIGDTRNREENRSHPAEKFSSVAESSIKGITPTRAYELLGSLNTKMGLDHVGSSGSDQHIAGTMIETSGIVENTTVGNVAPFGGSSSHQILQDLDKTTTESSRPRDNRSKVLGSTKHPNIIGSNITRVSTKSPRNDTEPLEKLRTNFPLEKQVPIEIIPDFTSDVEPVLNSPASIVPAVVQPDPESIEKEQELKERLDQDSDFAFV